MGYVDSRIAQAQSDKFGERMVIETLQAVIVAFILAFVFRSFVVEPFVIPTGSMAPTLRGAHLAARGPDSGYTFAVGPAETSNGFATPIQTRSYDVGDPMLVDEQYRYRNPDEKPQSINFVRERTRMGDRILVLKYLYALFEPQRYDVVVFKDPGDPKRNFIKRLIGLPSESIWLLDGDVFAAPDPEADPAQLRVQRKPEHVQRRVWQPVYHSDYIPLPSADATISSWEPPWVGPGWDVLQRRSYRLDTDQPSTLTFRHELRPILDDNVYNAITGQRLLFNVSDIRLAATVKPDETGLRTTIRLAARGHEFVAVMEDDIVELGMRPQDAQDWVVLDQATAHGAFDRPDRAMRVEFWHVDQALWLWINGELVAHGEYDWDAETRSIHATGLSVEEARVQSEVEYNPYAGRRFEPESAQLSWDFEGSPVTLYHVEVDRDLYYQPGNGTSVSLATHPDKMARLNKDQFFVCGDNSPASDDGRTWRKPVPWVATQMDPTQGVVPRNLMLGKAFFVYFPSPEGMREGGRRFVPSFGLMRVIF